MNESQIEAQLTTFFNVNHYGPDFHVNKNIKFDTNFSGELLPENKILKENLEKQIDNIFANSNYSIDDGPVPQELMDQWMPLYHKLNAIAALGSSIVLDESTLNNAANFLHNLDKSWSELVNEDSSLSGQFHSATNSWKSQPLTEEEIREKIEKKKAEVENL